MRTLTLFRHAKSSWDELGARDFDRPLNAKGRRAAQTMGKHMRMLGWSFDRVVASPAVRCIETLDAMFEGYGRRLTPVWDRRVYLASAPALLELVQEQPDSAERILLVGHNPGLEELALMLVPENADDEVARDAIEEKYPTAAIAQIDFAETRWENVDAHDGRLARFVRPRDLDPALGPDAVY